MTRLHDENLTIKLVLRKIMNIAIKYKRFYCVLIQNRFITIFLSGVGKQRSKEAAKSFRTRNEKIIM